MISIWAIIREMDGMGATLLAKLFILWVPITLFQLQHSRRYGQVATVQTTPHP
jgi:hypothetical protein